MIKSGMPCKHKGCLSHITHPCEGCNRIKGVNDYVDILWLKCGGNELRFSSSNILVYGKILEQDGWEEVIYYTTEEANRDFLKKCGVEFVNVIFLDGYMIHPDVYAGLEENMQIRVQNGEKFIFPRDKENR